MCNNKCCTHQGVTQGLLTDGRHVVKCHKCLPFLPTVMINIHNMTLTVSELIVTKYVTMLSSVAQLDQQTI